MAFDLAGIADEVRVHFPWGSLLRGVIGADGEVLAALSTLPRPGGSLTALVSVTERDGHEMPDADRVAARWTARGLVVSSIRPLTAADVDAAGSSWGKRLRAGIARDGLYIRAERTRSALGSDGR